MKFRIESSDGVTGYAECEMLLIGFGITTDAICAQYDDADVYVKVLESFKLEGGKEGNTIWVKPSDTKKEKRD